MFKIVIINMLMVSTYISHAAVHFPVTDGTLALSILPASKQHIARGQGQDLFLS